MASHKSDGGRIPRLKGSVFPQSHIIPSPGMDASMTASSSPTLRSATPHVSRPSSTKIGARKSSSSSMSESGRFIAPSNPTKIPSTHNFPSYSTLRAATYPSPSVTPVISSSSATNRNKSLSAYSTTTPSPLGAGQKQSTSGRLRNVIRRKAPTIGLHLGNDKQMLESTRPENLNVTIPVNKGQPISDYSQKSQSQTDSTTGKSSQCQNMMNSPESLEHNGPKELASLRTTFTARNPSSSTSMLPSASSPSTRYSGSPGIWSRTSTPTSLSSYSPGFVQPAKATSRLRQPSPSQTRTPVSSRQDQLSPHSKVTQPNPDLPSVHHQELRTTSPSTSDQSNSSLIQLHAASASATTSSLLPRKSHPASKMIPRINTNVGAEPRSSSQDKVQVSRMPESNKSGSRERNGGVRSHIPSRPTREGTHQLQLETSPIVQSNLSPDTVIGHKRRPLGEGSFISDRAPIRSNGSAATSVDSLQSRNSSQLPSRVPTSPELSRKPPRLFTKDAKVKESDKAPPSPSKGRRFGLFPKGSKPELEFSSEENRQIRKGPAAGTGHEGYGKYAQRGRRASVTSSSSRGRSTSTVRSAPRSVSSKSSVSSRPDLDLDDFLLERLEPVVINGGGMDEATLVQIRSRQSSNVVSKGPAPESIEHVETPDSYEYSTHSLASSTETVAKPAEDNHETHEQTEFRQKPPMTSRQKASNAGILLKLNTKVDSSAKRSRSRVTDPEQPTDITTLPSSARERQESRAQKKPSKRGLGLKWNFFQKAHGAGRNEPSIPPPTQVRAAISTARVRRPIAHYALLDTDPDTLEDIIRDVEDSPPTEEEESRSLAEAPLTIDTRKPIDSILLPSPPTLQEELKPSAKVYLNRDLLQSSPEQPRERTQDDRPARLTSVGRIPRVVSRRDRQHKPALQSFSRPFSSAESPSIAAPVTSKVSQSSSFGFPTMEAKVESYHGESSHSAFDFTHPFGNPMEQSTLKYIAGPYSANEFLAFSPRKDSTTTFASSTGSESLAAVTAVAPEPNSALTEDEVWGEYDDLIDHVLSPASEVSVRPDKTIEKLELAAMASRALQAGLDGTADHQAFSSAENPAVALTPASPTSSERSVHLRRSQIVSALHSSLAPSSQPSFSDIIACYHYDRSSESVDRFSQDNLSMPIPTIEQQASFLTSPSLNPSPSFETCRQRNTILFDIAERDREGPTAQTNIRSGSLMTSRWLSFGRVLFSPAHNHIKNGEDERILVVDGLGNDDWSFYCALTYPNAEVYNLNDGPAPISSKHPDAWQPPSNHHTIHHASLEDRFPFPRRFFTVAVLRFPAACPESFQDNIVSECKRVLQPGGYMEMSILDLDMVNMGIRTRKAVRQLKERTYLSDPSISLKPSSDSVQRLLGKYGFDNLRRCMVRIPVAGVIVRSSASSSSTSSSLPSTLVATATSSIALSAQSSSSTDAQKKAHSKASSNDTDLSLGDLLSDPSPSTDNDESIRKIVARVGRWWYTRCYEIPVLTNGDAALSIWSDKKLLRECQKRGTGFRLLIAYAQKPSEERKTASI
ncbi:hypothetical protein BDV25DRAFT_30352 [Aspergillus avenaceus]|uniref:Methyltransferase type 11 domain-containing protein n=1 Tax=Aspergillus avenaceus TaxID=36643 RepID=A0A5N6TN97_ASPAV|nr:hypothetical protein BDV25DRAFT_30352 [Aspergillus avenaceus]